MTDDKVPEKHYMVLTEETYEEFKKQDMKFMTDDSKKTIDVSSMSFDELYEQHPILQIGVNLVGGGRKRQSDLDSCHFEIFGRGVYVIPPKLTLRRSVCHPSDFGKNIKRDDRRRFGRSLGFKLEAFIREIMNPSSHLRKRVTEFGLFQQWKAELIRQRDLWRKRGVRKRKRNEEEEAVTKRRRLGELCTFVVEQHGSWDPSENERFLDEATQLDMNGREVLGRLMQSYASPSHRQLQVYNRPIQLVQYCRKINIIPKIIEEDGKKIYVFDLRGSYRSRSGHYKMVQKIATEFPTKSVRKRNGRTMLTLLGLRQWALSVRNMFLLDLIRQTDPTVQSIRLPFVREVGPPSNGNRRRNYETFLRSAENHGSLAPQRIQEFGQAVMVLFGIYLEGNEEMKKAREDAIIKVLTAVGRQKQGHELNWNRIMKETSVELGFREEFSREAIESFIREIREPKMQVKLKMVSSMSDAQWADFRNSLDPSNPECVGPLEAYVRTRHQVLFRSVTNVAKYLKRYTKKHVHLMTLEEFLTQNVVDEEDERVNEVPPDLLSYVNGECEDVMKVVQKMYKKDRHLFESIPWAELETETSKKWETVFRQRTQMVEAGVDPRCVLRDPRNGLLHGVRCHVIWLIYGGDGTDAFRSADELRKGLVMLWLKFGNMKAKYMQSKLNHRLVLIQNGKENWENLRVGIKAIGDKLMDLEKKYFIDDEGVPHVFRVHFSGDQKFLNMAMGMKSPSANFFCPICKYNRATPQWAQIGELRDF